MPHHDLVIIGSGSGNSLLTDHLGGLDIAIVEKGVFGGTCLNVGCIPTKMFVLPADRTVDAVDSARLGVTFPTPSVDWPAIRDRIFGRIDPISAGGEDYRRGQDHVTLYRTRARFTGERRLLLDTGEELTADRVVVAAGSRAVGLPLEHLTGPDPERGIHTSDTVMRMDALPRRMVVIGGGFVACEMAHVFDGLGVEVVQVQRSSRLLVAEEEEVSRRYTRIAGERYDLRLASTVSRAEPTGDGWRLTVSGPDGEDVVETDAVLLAVGRRPNSDLVEAAEGGLDLEPDGRIAVDAQQRTSVPGVWALGDISSPWQLKHVANHDARVVAHNLAVDLGRVAAAPRENTLGPVPHAVFGHPQIASFGPTSAQLEAAGTPYVTKAQSVGDVAYGWALEDRDGVLVVHASPEGDLLAAHMLGTQASSIIQPLIQAASLGQRVQDIARGQYWIHPALSEVVENALLGLPLQE